MFDVRCEDDAINAAYTELELPPHMDLPYYESPPGVQILHCIQFDDCVEGGDSVFVDAIAAAEELRLRFPEHFDTLARVPATFQKDHSARPEPARMFYRRPHIDLHREQTVGLPSPSSPSSSACAPGSLSVPIKGVYWSPPFEGTLRCAPEDCGAYYAAYAAFSEIINGAAASGENDGNAGVPSLRARLGPGDAVVFNQRRMLHGRDSFERNGGQRHLQGTYVSLDHFLNRLRAMEGIVERAGSGGGVSAVTSRAKARRGFDTTSLASACGSVPNYTLPSALQ